MKHAKHGCVTRTYNFLKTDLPTATLHRSQLCFRRSKQPSYVLTIQSHPPMFYTMFYVSANKYIEKTNQKFCSWPFTKTFCHILVNKI